MARLRFNNLGDGGATNGVTMTLNGTTCTWAVGHGFPTIASPDYAAFTVNPGTVNEEVVQITACTSGGTTATVVRNFEATQGGANAAPACSAAAWAHGPTAADAYCGGLLAVVSYNPASLSTYSTSSSTTSDMDATNLKVSFVAPPSGKVLIRLSTMGITSNSAATSLDWQMREGSGVVGDIKQVTNDSINHHIMCSLLITGLTAGSAHTYKWGFRSEDNSHAVTCFAGGVAGPAVMEVWGVPA